MEENTIEKYIKNNILDIEQLIKDYKTYIYTIAKNNSKGFLSNEDIEEIVSDTFLTIWHNKNKIEKDKILKNYIAAVTKNLVLKKLRENKNNKLNVNLCDENIGSQFNNIEYVYENNLIEETINEELKNFTKLEYKIFTKYYYFSKSIKEIASEMNISESLVKVKLYRIRKKLKKRLKEKGIIPKNLVIIIAILIIGISSFVIAKEIFKHFFLDSSNGVEEALNDGYVENYELQNNSYSNGISVDVESVLMDDYNLAIVFCLKFDNIEYVKNADFEYRRGCAKLFSAAILEENFIENEFVKKNLFLLIDDENDTVAETAIDFIDKSKAPQKLLKQSDILKKVLDSRCFLKSRDSLLYNLKSENITSDESELLRLIILKYIEKTELDVSSTENRLYINSGDLFELILKFYEITPKEDATILDNYLSLPTYTYKEKFNHFERTL